MILVDWGSLLGATDDYRAQPGICGDELAAYEQELSASLSFDVRELYLVSDGVFDRNGRRFILWPLLESIRRNTREWFDAEPGRGELVAIGDDGTGGRICVPRDGNSGVFLWDPLVAAPRWLANDLGDFWVGWTTRVITTHVHTP
jgi:SMI1/KNR4 family protein SUKH-1